MSCHRQFQSFPDKTIATPVVDSAAWNPARSFKRHSKGTGSANLGCSPDTSPTDLATNQLIGIMGLAGMLGWAGTLNNGRRINSPEGRSADSSHV